MTDGPRWLAVHQHRVRGLAAPFMLVLQHHLVGGAARIAAPVVPAGDDGALLIAPLLAVGGRAHRAVLLDMAAVPVRLLSRDAVEASVDGDAITNALDAIFRGYPVGLPLA